MSTEIDFESLVGTEADFYGVDNNCFRLDGTVYEAMEDESDGYRSSLGCVEVRDAKDRIFFRTPIARVVIDNADEGSFEGYKLTDLHDTHEWLRFGTDDYDDWYPTFRFEYSPKPPQE